MEGKISQGLVHPENGALTAGSRRSGIRAVEARPPLRVQRPRQVCLQPGHASFRELLVRWPVGAAAARIPPRC
jgi:hypothetical protein